MDSADLMQLLAGIALFIFSMSLLEDSLKQIAGRPFKQFLQRQTRNKIRAIASGTVVTAFLQSSSVVLLMVLSFVGAGVMSMRNALAVTLGANLGTTLDSWVVATLGFKVELNTISFPILVFALLVKVFLPSNNNIKNLTNFIIGVGLLFIGLEWMKLSVTELVNQVDLRSYAHLSPYLFILAGVVITAIIQSSSATIAITLTALYQHVIPFESAAAIVIGSELGTTLKIMLGSMGGSPDKKRVSTGNFIFNIVIIIIATIFLHPLIYFIRIWIPIKDPLIALVFFQTTINVIAIVLFYPFLGWFAAGLERLFTGGSERVITKYIHDPTKQFSEDTLQAAKKETTRLMAHTIAFNSKIFGIENIENDDTSSFASFKKFVFEKDSTNDSYTRLKQLHGEILEFLVSMQPTEMNPKEIEYSGKLISILRHVMHAAKNIKDIQHNINDIGVSENDTLHNVLIDICNQERTFYNSLQQKIQQIEAGNTNSSNEQPLLESKQEYQNAYEDIYKLLNKNLISEYNASTLLNMQREIYSSHKALLRSIENLKELNSIQLRT